jgi:cytidylate kinase
MSIITLSRGCFSHGKEVAEKVGSLLGYAVLSRETLIEKAHQRYHIPEKSLIQSVYNAPGVLERITRGRERYLSYIQAILLEHAREDNLVYHGNASHVLLPNIAHVLNVRIIADMKDRIEFMRQNQKITTKEATNHIMAEDANRARWAHYLYKIDITDPQLYDMIINIKSMKIGEASRMIFHATEMETYKSTPESRQAVIDLALSARIQAAIEKTGKPNLKISVTANNGNVRIRAEAQSIRKTGYTHPKTETYIKETIKQEIADEISAAISDIPDINNVVYEVVPPSYS